jgi:arsenate reductase (glutaredoxin)
MKEITVYGIPNCDTIKKTFGWLKKNKIAYTFHDYKKEGITAARLTDWSKRAGWELLFNKRSSTWKLIASEHNGEVRTQAEAIHIMQEHTSIIKRPVIEINGKLLVGYDEKEFAGALLK